MLTEVPYSKVSGYLSRAKRDGVSLKNAMGARWFKIAGVDGFCSVLPISRDGSKVRIKGFWIAPEYRGQGVGTLAFQALIELLEKEGSVKIIESISRKIRFYESQGFKKVKQLPSATTEKWRFHKCL